MANPGGPKGDPAFVTVVTLCRGACSETGIELKRKRTIKLEPGFSGSGFRFSPERRAFGIAD